MMPLEIVAYSLALYSCFILLYAPKVSLKFAWAKFMKRPIVAIHSSTGISKLKIGELTRDGVLKCDGYPITILKYSQDRVEDNHLTFHSYVDQAVTVGAEQADTATTLKENGITNSEELNKQENNELLNITDLPDMHTFRFIDFKDYLNVNVKPASIAATIQREISEVLADVNSIFTMKNLTVFFLILIGAGVAYSMVTTQGSNQEQAAKLMSVVAENAKCQIELNITKGLTHGAMAGVM